jgi:hypothetical protein
MVVVGLAVLAGLILAVSAAPASALSGVEYKLHFTGEGKETLSTTSETLEQETRQQNATWTFLPKDVNIWLPKFNGPPGEANAKEAEVPTVDERISKGVYTPIGEVKETGTYFEEHESTSEAEPFSCNGSIVFVGPIIHRVIVTPLDPTIDLETDFQGTLGIANKGVIGNTVGEPCWTTGKGEEGFGFFNFQWDNPHGQRLQVGMSIPAQQIGEPSIGGPAMDFSNVETSESAQDCLGSHGCKVTFKLTGEYDLEKICEGTFESSWSCGNGSGSSSTNNNNNPNNPKPGGGGKQAEEEAKKKEEAKAAAATKKKEEEKKKQAKEEAKASVKIESVKLTAAGLLVKVKTSEPGAVTVTGTGLKKTTKTLPAGTHTLKIPVSKKARAKHQKTKLTVSLKVGSKTVTASKKLTL